MNPDIDKDFEYTPTLLDQAKEMKPFMLWFAQLMIMSVAGWFLWDTGVIMTIVNTDITKLSIAIFALFVISSFMMGWSSWRVSKTHLLSKLMEKRLFLGWFVSEMMMALGLCGTVIGFIVLFQGNFADVSFDDPETVREIIVAIASGMGIALYTTITGLVCSQLLKLQLVNVEVALDDQA